MSAQPKISIIISTFNCADSLQACLDSIYAQTYLDIEIIVADGASTDGTVDMIEANAGCLGAWFSEPDRGIYDAWNKALGKASGDWIYFLGADDVLHGPDALKQAAGRLADVPEGTLLAYGQIWHIGSGGKVAVLGEDWATARTRITSEMSIPHQGTFHARALFDRLGPFDDSLNIAADYKLILASVAMADPVFLGDVIIADKMGGGRSELRRDRVACLLEARRVQAELGHPIRASWVFGMLKGVVWYALTRAAEGLCRVRRFLSARQLN